MIKIKKSYIYIVVIMIEFLLSMRFINIVGMSGSFLYTNLSRLVFLVAFVRYFFKYKKISKSFIYISLYYFILFISTLINKGNIRTLIMTYYPVITLCMLIEYYGSNRFNIMIKSLALLFKILVIINIFIYLINPNIFGEYRYFITEANQIGIPYSIGISCIFMDYKLNSTKTKFFHVWFFIFSFSILFLFYSSNAKMAWLLILILYYFPFLKKIILTFGLTRIFISYLILAWLIIFQNVQKYFNFLIQGVFHKNLTFSGRTYIWQEAVKQINSHLIIGNGLSESSNIIYIYQQVNSAYIRKGYFSCHNTYLQELYYGGILSLIPITLFLIDVWKSVKVKDEITYFLIIAAIGICFVFMFEAVSYVGLFMIGILLKEYQKNIMMNRED